MMTLTCIEIEHAQSKTCVHNAVLGVVNRHDQNMISTIRGPCLTLGSKEELFY